MEKVLLYSGGMDSWLIDKLWKPNKKLFIRIHTKNNELEYKNLLSQIANGLIDNSNLIILDYDLSMFEMKDANYYLPLRNLHFVTLAAHYGDTICLGATGSSTHFDKNLTFAEKSENVINYLLSEKNLGKIKIVLPYMNITKTELLKQYLEQGGDIDLAYKCTTSCYEPIDNKPCMNCTSCASKFTAFYNNGYKFDKQTIQKFMNFVAAHKDLCKQDTLKTYVEIFNKQNDCD